jgi:hypothetical protein
VVHSKTDLAAGEISKVRSICCDHKDQQISQLKLQLKDQKEIYEQISRVEKEFA